jgi:hypothetical protein
MTLVLYPWLLAIEPVMSPMEAFTVRPGLLPSIVNGVVHVQFAFSNMIIWAPSPPVWLTLGFAQVNLPVIFVCAPAMTANPQSSAGSKITFRMTTSGERGWELSNVRPVPLNSAHAIGRCARTPGGWRSDLS